jgi:hypothetical protein
MPEQKISDWATSIGSRSNRPGADIIVIVMSRATLVGQNCAQTLQQCHLHEWRRTTALNSRSHDAAYTSSIVRAKRIYCGGNAHEKTKTDFCGCGTLWWPYSDRCIRDANRTNPNRHGCTGRASALGLRPLSVLVATKLLRGLRRLFVLPTPPLSPLLASPSLLVMFRGGANTPPLSF